MQVRLTSIYNTTIEDVIPGDSGGFGHAQFLPTAPVYQLPVSSEPSHTSRNLLQVLQQDPDEQHSRDKYSLVPARAPAPAADQQPSLYNSTKMQVRCI